MKNVHFVSLGCARNLVDSEVMAGLLQKDGYKLCTEPNDAQLIIVNTCGFIDTAKKESVESILDAAQYKDPKRGKCEKLVVTGCLSERYPYDLKESIPEIDLITGSAAFSSIVKKVAALDPNSESRVEIDQQRLADFDLPRLNSQPFYTAYLKLAEGCAKRCSFCVIPKLRGGLRSRSIPALIRETQGLVDGGVKELNLIAQDLTDFGRDRSDGTSLAKFLNELVRIDKLEWARLFYTYPDQLDDEVISIVKNEPKICNYLDVPVQHINDTMLKRMNRHTNGKQILDMLYKLKKEIPDIVIRTSLMVGFPGETKEHFNQLKDFISEGIIDQMGVFTYSHEEGAPSFQFPDDISPELKEERRSILHDQQLEVQKTKLSNWVGKKIKVLVEGEHTETELLLKGRHYGQAPDIDNITLINAGTANIGDFVDVNVREVVGLDLCGEIEGSL